MIAVVFTQCYENYGAHDWDGTGECPQYWKAKGGQDIKITDLPKGITREELIKAADDAFSIDTIEYREYVIQVSFVEDDYLSDFEKSQLECDGKITYPEKSCTFEELLDLVTN